MGRIRLRTEHLPRQQWKVVIQEQHPGYISWGTFVDNQQRLAENSLRNTGGEASRVVREGTALLQGLLRCGVCGRRMSPIYMLYGDSTRYVCRRRNRTGKGVCQSLGGSRLHRAVVEEFLDALSPASMQVTIAALQQVDEDEDAALDQLLTRREQAKYEADRARRQYDAVEPENRIVARTLEAEWNRKLTVLAEIDRQIEDRHHQKPPPLNTEERQRLLDLGLDLRQIWGAPTTLPQEKKQLLRAVFDDVVVRIDRTTRLAHLTFIWQGGATTETEVKLPRIGERSCVDGEQLVAEVRKMASSLTDVQIAQTLVRRGIRTSKGLSFTLERVRFFRKRHDIPEFSPNPSLADEPMVTAEQAVDILGVTNTTVLRWLRDGFFVGEQVSPRAPWMIKACTLSELKTARKAPKGWVPPKEAVKALGVTRETVLHLARTGKVESMMVGTGRKRGLRINVFSRTSMTQSSLFVHN
jgi:hypothetical protein